MAFLRSSEPDPPSLPHLQGLLRPVIVEPDDPNMVVRLLEILDRAIAERSTDLTYQFGIALNRAGGFPDTSRMSKTEEATVFLEIGQADSSTSHAALQRPWLWAAAVAQDALARGDNLLASRIAMATWIWAVEFGPKMNSGAFFEGVVAAPDNVSQAAAFSQGLRAAIAARGDRQIEGRAALYTPSSSSASSTRSSTPTWSPPHTRSPGN